MKLHLINRASSKNSSFTVSHNLYPNFLKIWHSHPELELVVVMQSTGTRFIGDSIEKFEAGDVVLIGKNLPHMWLNDEVYFKESSNIMAEATAVHFKEDFLGVDFFETPEMKTISQLFDRALQGIKFVGLDVNVINRIQNLLSLDAFERTIKFIEILQLLARHNNYQTLSSSGFISSFNNSENGNLDKVYEYIFKNFNRPIHSKDVANIVHMNPSSFSRFFKRIHRKTFTRYLNEVRIGYACKLLLEENNITYVCYESGFNNISNFNRQFKTIKSMTPTMYMKSYTSNLE